MEAIADVQYVHDEMRCAQYVHEDERHGAVYMAPPSPWPCAEK